MRTMCINLDREDALETVLEVPIPDETFAPNKQHIKPWQGIKTWLIRPPPSGGASTSMEIQFLLGVIGAPLIPLPISSNRGVDAHFIKGQPIERSMAKYIVQQYIAASGGDHALNSTESMCAIGKVTMASSEIEDLNRVGKMKVGVGKLGSFVLWQKKPHLWSLELMVSGYKMSAGSDGKLAWRQTPWQHHSSSSRGPPRPLRRSLQGLDPRSTADLFFNSVCIGEKAIDGEDCFVLKMESEASALRARSSSDVEMMRHTVWGYFSQRTGLLVHLQDSHLLRMKSDGNNVFWETTMESWIQDYRTINGVNVAHSGRTTASLFRFGEDSENNIRTRMEEEWCVEEVDFNVRGLSAECFLAPADLKSDDEECGVVDGVRKGGFRYKNCNRVRGGRRVVAIDDHSLELFVADESL